MIEVVHRSNRRVRLSGSSRTRARFGAKLQRRPLTLAMGLSIVLGSIAPFPAFAQNTPPTGEDLRFRAEFGLSADPAYVAEVRAAGWSDEDYGVPLTPDEVAEIDARVAAEPQIAALQDQLRKTVPAFGGLYIDQAGGGVVDVAFTDEPAQYAAVMAPYLKGLEVRTRRVTYTEAELLRLNNRIAGERDIHRAMGIATNEVYPDIRANAVKVGIDPYGPAEADALMSRYGIAARIFAAGPGVHTACTNRDNCPGPPLVAGLHLFDSPCTNAFLGRYNDGSGDKQVTLSAGHCADLVAAGHTYQHPNNVNLGKAIKEVYATGSNADAMIVQIPAALRSNRIYYTTGSWFPVFELQSRSEEVDGMVVCQSSRISGYTCGELYAWGFSITYADGTTLYNQRSATYAVAGGDSGGPVFRGNEARGIQSGVNTAGRAIYSHISYVVAAIGMVVHTS